MTGWPRYIVDATSVHWTDGNAGTVTKVALGGGSPTTLASGQGANGIAVDATSVYWTDNNAGTVMSRIRLRCSAWS